MASPLRSRIDGEGQEQEKSASAAQQRSAHNNAGLDRLRRSNGGLSLDLFQQSNPSAMNSSTSATAFLNTATSPLVSPAIGSPHPFQPISRTFTQSPGPSSPAPIQRLQRPSAGRTQSGGRVDTLSSFASDRELHLSAPRPSSTQRHAPPQHLPPPSAAADDFGAPEGFGPPRRAATLGSSVWGSPSHATFGTLTPSDTPSPGADIWQSPKIMDLKSPSRANSNGSDAAGLWASSPTSLSFAQTPLRPKVPPTRARTLAAEQDIGLHELSGGERMRLGNESDAILPENLQAAVAVTLEPEEIGDMRVESPASATTANDLSLDESLKPSEAKSLAHRLRAPPQRATTLDPEQHLPKPTIVAPSKLGRQETEELTRFPPSRGSSVRGAFDDQRQQALSEDGPWPLQHHIEDPRYRSATGRVPPNESAIPPMRQTPSVAGSGANALADSSLNGMRPSPFPSVVPDRGAFGHQDADFDGFGAGGAQSRHAPTHMDGLASHLNHGHMSPGPSLRLPPQSQMQTGAADFFGRGEPVGIARQEQLHRDSHISGTAPARPPAPGGWPGPQQTRSNNFRRNPDQELAAAAASMGIHPASAYQHRPLMTNVNRQASPAPMPYAGGQQQSAAAVARPTRPPAADPSMQRGSSNGIPANNLRSRGMTPGHSSNTAPSMAHSTRSPLLEEFRTKRAAVASAPHINATANRSLPPHGLQGLEDTSQWTLDSIRGHIVEFCMDQHGSRFAQEQLDRATRAQIDWVFEEVRPSAKALTSDVFGNYVVQKIFDYGNAEQRLSLAQDIRGNVVHLSLGTYGCRVVQKALDYVPEWLRLELAKELHGHVLELVQDQNANHVVQKLLSVVQDTEAVRFVSDTFRGRVLELGAHCYSCRVLQRVFERCGEAQARPLLEELHAGSDKLAMDQYGNYVIQWILQKGLPQDKNRVVESVSGNVLAWSRHKFASNVVEQVVRAADSHQRRHLASEILQEVSTPSAGSSDVAANLMLQDAYANYVLQRFLELCDHDQKMALVDTLQPRLAALRKGGTAGGAALAGAPPSTLSNWTKHLTAVQMKCEAIRASSAGGSATVSAGGSPLPSQGSQLRQQQDHHHHAPHHSQHHAQHTGHPHQHPHRQHHHAHSRHQVAPQLRS